MDEHALFRRLTEIGRRRVASAPKRHAENVGELPISRYAQDPVWKAMVERGAAADYLFHAGFGLRIKGSLDVPALRRALDEIVARHDALRMTIVPAEPLPITRVLAPAPASFRVVEVPGADPAAREERLRPLAITDYHQPFPTGGPYFRAILYRIDTDDHLLTITDHHIIASGESNMTVMEELGTLYDAFAAGEPSPLDPPPLQLTDFLLAWAREPEGTMAARLAPWRRKWGSFTGSPTLSSRPSPTRDERSATLTFRYADDLFPQLDAVARAEGATLFMLLSAAFLSFVRMRTGGPDVALGYFASMRPPHLKHVIGPFLNLVLLRGEFTRVRTFRELLHDVREDSLQALEDVDLPFDLALPPGARVGFMVGMQAWNQERQFFPSSPLKVSIDPLSGGMQTRHELNVSFHAPGASASCYVVYSPSQFQRDEMAALIDDFGRLLVKLRDRPDVPIADLAI